MVHNSIEYTVVSPSFMHEALYNFITACFEANPINRIIRIDGHDAFAEEHQYIATESNGTFEINKRPPTDEGKIRCWFNWVMPDGTRSDYYTCDEI